MREKSSAEGTVQGETSQVAGRERVVRRGRGARGVVRMKRWSMVWRRRTRRWYFEVRRR